jgi:hypothetical protein
MLRPLLISLVLLSLAACAGNNRFVLLEEEDGSVGAIVVENEAGSQTINQARTATKVASATATPGTPEAVSQAEIDKTWGASLQASPLKPSTFLFYFITGTDTLTEQSRSQFPFILDSLKEYPAPEVSIIGHTDRTGSAENNARLALDLLLPSLYEYDNLYPALRSRQRKLYPSALRQAQHVKSFRPLLLRYPPQHSYL